MTGTSLPLSERLIRLYEGLVLDKPFISLALVVALLILSASFFSDFQLDVSADSLVLENDADLEYYRNIRARYGSDDYLVVTYSPKADLFSVAELKRLQVLRDRLRAIEHVESVVSILDVPLLESPPLSLTEVEDGAPTLEQPGTDIKLARRELISSPLYSNRLMSPDGKTCAIQINLKRDEIYHDLLKQRDALREKKLTAALTAEENQQLKQVSEAFDLHRQGLIAKEAQLISHVRATLAEYESHAQIHLGGVPMIVADMMNFIRHDLATFGVAVLLILSAILVLVFRQLRWLLLPLLTASAVTIVTVGFLGMTGWPVTVVSSNFIALLLIFSLSLTVHLIVRYRELQFQTPAAKQRWLVSETLRSKAAPCFFTVITTMVAFGSLVVSNIRPVIDFGWIMVFAMAAALLLSFTLFPSALMLLEPAKPREGKDLMGQIMQALAKLVDLHGGKLLLISAIIMVSGAFGIARLTVENRFIDYFHSSTEIFQGMKLIDEKLGGTTPLDVIINAPVEEEKPEEDGLVGWVDDLIDDFLDEDAGITATSYWFNSFMLPEVGEMHRFLESLPETGKVLSLHTTKQVLDKLDADGNLDDFFLSIVFKRLPEDVKAQIISPYLSEDGQQIRFSIRVYESDKGLNRKDLLNKIQAYLDEERGKFGETSNLSGMVVLYNNLLQSLFQSQIQTLGVVFLVIMLTFAVVFRSFKVAALAIIPNAFPAIAVLGLLGGLGIPLDIMTITIAAIAVGIAVDNTIHYIHRYRTEWQIDGDYLAAMYRAHGSIGRAMYYTSITITTGFIIMVLSDFIPTVYFGLFTAFAMISALLADVLMLPAIFKVLKPYGKSPA